MSFVDAIQPWGQFDWDAMQRVYTTREVLSSEQVELLMEDTQSFLELGIPGLRWTPAEQTLSVYRWIPLLVHYEALAAGLGIPFRGIRDYHEATIRLGLEPSWRLNQTIFYAPPARARIGRMMVELGLVDEETLDRSLDIQAMALEKVGFRPALGSLLLSLGTVSYPDFYQVLGLQAQLPFKDMDTSAAHIFDTIGKQLEQPAGVSER